ncbi:MAG TPA: cyclase family protein [Gemmatimonadota bacterium]|nr:cyclase family protein [Gemmatimonadota bacterium]
MKARRRSAPTAVAALASLIVFAPADAQWPDLDAEVEVVDLTHSFDASAVYWPTAEPFQLEVVSEGTTDFGWYAAKSFCAAEHGGTHLDAPVHFAEGRRGAAEIPLEDLIGEAVVVDVAVAASADPDFLIEVRDLETWETAHGPIPTGAIVLLRTGWGERWPDRERYLGTSARGVDAVRDLHFPGLSEEGARWLVGRGIRAVGIDTASIDRGQSTDFRAHRVLAAADVPIFENVAALDRVHLEGAWIVALPMKIAGGTGGPLRIVALQPRFLPADADE